MNPLLTILTPAITERISQVHDLQRILMMQESGIEGLYVHSVDMDERGQSQIGDKRTRLLKSVQTPYFAFMDDDDKPLADYLPEILAAIIRHHGVDVITFNQSVVYDAQPFQVQFGLGNPVEAMQYENGESGKLKDIKRPPFHVCVWRTALVQDIPFPSVGFGEDWAWSEKAIQRAETSYHINKTLHQYIYDPKISAAPTETNEVWKNPNE